MRYVLVVLFLLTLPNWSFAKSKALAITEGVADELKGSLPFDSKKELAKKLETKLTQEKSTHLKSKVQSKEYSIDLMYFNMALSAIKKMEPQTLTADNCKSRLEDLDYKTKVSKVSDKRLPLGEALYDFFEKTCKNK